VKIVVAPDTFKGSISAIDICSAAEEGIRRVIPEAQVIAIPLADGGEGTVENMVFSSYGTLKQQNVRGPLGQQVNAAYGVLGDGQTIVVEMAQASGLTLIPHNERDPLTASTYGTGELIKHALDEGYRKFVIGLGGSATNDGGTGMLKALGMKLLKEDGTALPEGGGHLGVLAYYDDFGLDSRIKESSFTIASDVTNKLCGPQGASAVFGPQKGASPEMVQQLDQALNHFAEIVLKQKGIEMREMEGGGAAGGMGAGLITFLQAEVKSGIEIIMEEIHFEDLIVDADLVITGEGKLDAQTLSGKVIAGVCNAAQKHNAPVIALCGGLELNSAELNELGLLSAFSIVPGPCSLEEAMKKAPDWIMNQTESFMRIIRNYNSKFKTIEKIREGSF
jgi:glycerate 2-kinase